MMPNKKRIESKTLEALLKALEARNMDNMLAASIRNAQRYGVDDKAMTPTYDGAVTEAFIELCRIVDARLDEVAQQAAQRRDAEAPSAPADEAPSEPKPSKKKR